MAHKVGFTGSVLNSTLLGCGFKSSVTVSKSSEYALWAIAYKTHDVSPDDCISELRKHVNLSDNFV